MYDDSDRPRCFRLAGLRKETAATSIEYALVASLISVMIVAAAALVGLRVTALYDAVVKVFP